MTSQSGTAPAAPRAREHEVLAYLDELIRSGDVAPGGRLPTERELAARVGANRTTVRKALLRLELEGRILRHVGRGTFVVEPPAPSGSGPSELDEYSPVTILEVRMMLEPRVAAAACLSATQRDLRTIAELHARGVAAPDYEGFELCDAAFHRAIGESTHSPLLARFYEILDGARQGEQWGSLKRRSFSPQRRVEYEEQHEAIVIALTDRDPVKAASAMEAHILAVRQNLLHH